MVPILKEVSLITVVIRTCACMYVCMLLYMIRSVTEVAVLLCV